MPAKKSLEAPQPASDELFDYCRRLARAAAQAARPLGQLSGAVKNQWLRRSGELLGSQAASILQANAEDLRRAPEYSLSDAQVDRLRLDPERLNGVRSGLEAVAALPDPVGEVIRGERRPNGLNLSQIRVPLGVVFFIYESRPNVTADAAALCIKSGNAVILRGGKEAHHTSTAIVECLLQAADETGVPRDAIQWVATIDRAAVGHLLKMNESIQVVIPRGGESLIRRVANEASMPVMKHFHGNCHVYLDESADLEMAVAVTVNSKCQRMGVCNACESLLVHRAAAPRILPEVAAALQRHGVEIRGDDDVVAMIAGASSASEADYATEYLGPVISVKIVDSLEQAVDHIERFGSGHTESIVTADVRAAEKFAALVDSAAVMINASTRFHDGGELGLGAEIGISTDKFHARGPCGLRELTTTKYIVRGDGHIRE